MKNLVMIGMVCSGGAFFAVCAMAISEGSFSPLVKLSVPVLTFLLSFRQYRLLKQGEGVTGR
jgi:hypothetical protein